MKITKLDRYGRILIPKSVREALNLKPGVRVALFPLDGRLTSHPLTETPMELRGSVQVAGPQDFSAIRKEITLRATERPTRRDDAERHHGRLGDFPSEDDYG